MTKVDLKTNKPLKWTEKAQFDQLSSPEAENDVVSFLMHRSEFLPQIADMGLEPKMFKNGIAKVVFKAIVDLFVAKKSITRTTVIESVKESGSLISLDEFKSYLNKIMVIDVATRAHLLDVEDVRDACLIIREYYIRRESLKAAMSLQGGLSNKGKDVFDIASDCALKLFQLCDQKLGSTTYSGERSISERLKQLDKKPKRGVSTGVEGLDHLLRGLKPSELTVVGARPSVGKTAFLTHLFLNAVEHGKNPLFFSLEMSLESFMDRLIAYLAEVPLYRLRDHDLTAEDWNAIYEKTASYVKSGSTLVFDADLSLNDVLVKARQVLASHKVDIIFIDYLTNLRYEGNHSHNMLREQQVAEISKGLKRLALSLGIHVVVASQLNRTSEYRGERPRSAELRESGQIEQDADNIILLHRPERAGITIDELGNSTEGVMEIILAKQRNGPCGKVLAHFDKETLRIKQT